MRDSLIFTALFFGIFCFANVEGIKLKQRAEEKLPWWEEGIIYQVYPRSHQDSDGDGVGDLTGIMSRLDHFVDIGISAVWISPIYTSPMKDFGYDISNFTDIEPIFGNMSTFQSLSAALKERDIKLVMDFVPNHSSDEHEWFIKSTEREDPYTDYYVWKNSKGVDENGTQIPPNNWISVFGGSAWEWNEVRQQFYLHAFVIGQPDLNYENPAVLTEMLSAVKFWLDMGVDGFRMDAVPYLFEDQEFKDEPEDPNRPPESLPDEYRYWSHPYTYDLQATRDALAQFRKLIDIYSLADGKERCMMVEAGIPTLEGLFKYYGNTTYPIAHFPFNFGLIQKINKDFNASSLNSIVTEWFEKMPEGKTANWLVGNHDNHRMVARFGDYITDPFNMIIHLLPGSSVSYYGEEIGMEDTFVSWEDTVDPAGCNVGPDRYEQFTRDPERTPMQWDNTQNSGFSSANKTWLPMNPNYTVINVELQKNVEESHLGIYKKVAQLRKSNSFKYGSLETHSLNNEAVFAFSRVYNQTGFVVVANFGDETQFVNVLRNFDSIPSTASIYLRSKDFKPDDYLIGDVISTESVEIGSKHSLILQF